MMRAMNAEEVLRDAFKRHQEVVEKSEAVLGEAKRAAELLVQSLQEGKKVLACGNGGSAADAEHFIGELLCRYKKDRKSFPGISLVSTYAATTAIANDYGFEHVFERQIEGLGQAGDLLVAFSTSGKSKNVILALSAARKRDMKTILLTGSHGSSLTDSADILILVPSEETACIQEIHELIYHGWCEYLDSQS